MKISKKDALLWFRFFAELPEDEPLMPRQQELASAVFAQLETAAEARRAALENEIPHLKTLAGRTRYVGPDERFPQGCKSCLLGTGLSAVRKTNRCDARCPFCYDYGVLDQIPPIGEGLWEIGGTRFYERDLPLLLAASKRPTGIAYVYLEPFMEIEKYYGVIRAFADAGIHQHLYTNGIRATEETLRALGEAGLPEIRFNLGASRAADRVIDNIRIAKKYIPLVGIETPMTPDYYEVFHQKKSAILATGLDFMNSAELHLNENNLPNYLGETLYACRMGYVSPVWSRELTLRLMAEADRESWDVVVHDCSNMTKFARDLNLKAKEGGWFGASSYASEFDRMPYEAFLPALEDDAFPFVEEEPLPEGYRPGDIVL
ncbi:MAG: radical SAM protein [Clostridia bacterium]|nr:radical SAM protein [Clostridia bacterium]